MANLTLEPRFDLVCKDCSRMIPERCTLCRQFIYKMVTNPNEICRGCMQVKVRDDTDEDCEQLNDGTWRFRCSGCNRPRDSCLKCERAIYSDSASESEEEDGEEEAEQEECEDDDNNEDSNGDEEEEEEPPRKISKKN